MWMLFRSLSDCQLLTVNVINQVSHFVRNRYLVFKQLNCSQCNIFLFVLIFVFLFAMPRLIHLYNCQKSKRTRICLRQLCRALKELKSRVAQSLTHFTELLTRSLIELSWTIKKDCWRIEEILRYGKNILFSSSWYRS